MTSNLHGALFEFLRNDLFDAKDVFNLPQAGNPLAGVKPKFRQNQFGGSMGGPIKQDKTLFFADYEAFRRVQGRTFTAGTPTACPLGRTACNDAQQLGNFSDIATLIYDPVSHTPYWDPNYQYMGSGMWTRGAHTIKFGASVLDRNWSTFQILFKGKFNINSNRTSSTGSGTGTGANSFAFSPPNKSDIPTHQWRTGRPTPGWIRKDVCVHLGTIHPVPGQVERRLGPRFGEIRLRKRPGLLPWNNVDGRDDKCWLRRSGGARRRVNKSRAHKS